MVESRGELELHEATVTVMAESREVLGFHGVTGTVMAAGDKRSIRSS